MNLAQLSGIDTLDTAIVYGDSEKLIGKLDTKLLKIVTKINISPNKKNLRNQIIEKFKMMCWYKTHRWMYCYN